MNKYISNILNYVFVPPAKLAILILCLIPILWLLLAGEGDKADYLMAFILDFKFR